MCLLIGSCYRIFLQQCQSVSESILTHTSVVRVGRCKRLEKQRKGLAAHKTGGAFVPSEELIAWHCDQSESALEVFCAAFKLW